MDDKAEFEKFFERVGDHYLHPSFHGEKIWPVTIEEMYQHFKARMISEMREDRHKSPTPNGSDGGRGGSKTLGGLRWSEERGCYIGPGGGADSLKFDPHWKNTGMGGKL